MKTVAWIIGIALLAVIGYGAAGPYLAVAEIKTGIIDQDADLLAARIDFPTLRQNLKDQVNAAMMKSAAQDLQDNPLAALAAGLATRVVDSMVDSLVTPAGLAQVMEGHRPAKSIAKPSVPVETRPPKTEELFQNARYTYDSLSQFSVWVPNDAGQETRFVLQREGLSWRLVNLVLPRDH